MTPMARWSAPVLLMALAIGSAAPGDEAKDVSGDLKAIQGTWVSADDEGQEHRWVFKGDTLRATIGGNEYVSTVTLDPKATPQPAADFKVDEAPDDSAGRTALGIYKLEGDRLTFCFAHPGLTNRPAEFKRVEGEVILVELKKAK